MNKHYNPEEIEQKWYQTWEDNNYFAIKDQSTNNAFCIMIPPPNVTGTLHMGHGFGDTVQDTLIRYHRMLGDTTLWQAGTDHAGIATQMVVERQLEETGTTRHDLGRDKFINRIWDWKTESGNTITSQLRRLGCSLDWSRERFTMDEGLSDAVRQVFVQLYDEGLIYRGKRLVNWDPVLHTALSDLEVIAKEESGFMYHIKYPLTDGNGFIEIATTRPETMLADGALAINPTDKRYQSFLGKMVNVPLTDRIIPIVSDDYVDAAFGTGCVKITPAHDFNDWQVGQRHDMEIINLFTKSATMNDNAPKAYQGLDRFVARTKIIDDLKKQGLLVKIEPHKLKPPRGDRSGAIVEPYLTDQWYVKMTNLAEPALKAVQNGDIKFVPDNWKNTYYRWLEDIQDWCISRQIWWGHQIPAWYDKSGNIFVGLDEQSVRKKYKLTDDVILTQDEDVLDTWFSSALWPFSTLGYPKKTTQLDKFYPTSVLVTGFDIIFFWVARMIMFGLKFMKDVPFKEIYIHGLVRDSHGKKMSKSKGNVLDPIDLIDGISLENLLKKRTKGLMQPAMKKQIQEQTRKDFPDGIKAFGTDALRFTFASLATTGRDINFDLGRIDGYRNFCNKIWNASRFVLLQTEGKNISKPVESHYFSLPDIWIKSRLQQVIKEVSKAMDSYRLDLASQTIYDFIWNDYCDWYLELSKITLNDDLTLDEVKQANRYQLLKILEITLRMTHPIMPYITEEIWQRIAPMLSITDKSIMMQSYPTIVTDSIDLSSIEQINWLQDFILGVRKIRGEMNIAPNKKLPILLQNVTNVDLLDKLKVWLIQFGKLDSITILDDNIVPEESAMTLVGNMKIFIPLAGLIDKEAEIVRLNKELLKLNNEIKRVSTKLNNENFLKKAPEAVVKKEQNKLSTLHLDLKNINRQKQNLKV